MTLVAKRGRPKGGPKRLSLNGGAPVSDETIERILGARLGPREQVQGLVVGRCVRCDSNLVVATVTGLTRLGDVVERMGQELSCLMCGEEWEVARS